MLSNSIIDFGHKFSEYLPLLNKNSFFMSPTTPRKIEIKRMSLSEYKSTDIPIKIIKASLLSLSIYLNRIYNLSFEEGMYIDLLKFATISPIHKGDSKMSLTNYRSIPILPVFSKILEWLVHKCLMNFLIKNNSLFEHQFGFLYSKLHKWLYIWYLCQNYKCTWRQKDCLLHLLRYCQSVQYS